jgi:signal peptidase II
MAYARGKTWSQRLAPWLGLAAIVTLTDQLTKITIQRTMKYGDVQPVTDFFNLVLAYNKGAAFSFLRDASGWQGPMFTTIGIAASLLVIFLLARHGAQRLFSLALALILGGAVGNVIDRLAYGHVIDFVDIHWRSWHWPAFNVADSSIVCGATLLILDELLRVRKSK